MSPSRSSRGFTLTEILVVLVIVAALAALITTAALSVRRKAHRSACLSNLRQIGVGLESYLQDHGDILPDWQPGRKTKMDTSPVLETGLQEYLGNPETFHCPADRKEYARSGSSYIWNSSQNGRRRTNLTFFGAAGEARKIPLISDKEGWHSGEPSVNFLYADLSASTKIQFGVNE